MLKSSTRNLISGIILLSGIYEAQEQYQHDCNRVVEDICGLRDATKGKFREASPLYLIKKNMNLPPIVLMTGEKDKVLMNSS